jgi:ribose transport system permease protein
VTAEVATATTARPSVRTQLGALVRRNPWTTGLYVLLVALVVFTALVHRRFGFFDLETISQQALPLGLAAAAQAVVVIGGGIDLSVGSMMALTNVTAAALMEGASTEMTIVIAIGVLLMGLLLGTINGVLIVISRVPDIVVTLAMLYIWGGAALLVLSSPGGAAPPWLKEIVDGGLIVELVPLALVVLLVAVGAIWLPLRRSRLGLAIYAIGSDRLAAFRSGVDVDRTKIASYAVCGLLSAAGGLSLSAVTGIGTPTVGAYTLAGVAAIVLGGVSLAGGRGGMLGPIAAAYVLTLIEFDLVVIGVDPNFSTMIQGLIMVLVVMVAGLASYRRSRRR